MLRQLKEAERADINLTSSGGDSGQDVALSTNIKTATQKKAFSRTHRLSSLSRSDHLKIWKSRASWLFLEHDSQPIVLSKRRASRTTLYWRNFLEQSLSKCLRRLRVKLLSKGYRSR